MTTPRFTLRHYFLLSTIALYGVAALFNASFVWAAIQDFLVMFVHIIPILGIVLVIMVLTNLFVTPARLQRHVGEASGFKGWFYAIALGIVVSGPPYILYPLLGEFKRHGMKDALLAAFLYNRNVKIPFLPVMIYYFGLAYAIVLSLYIISFSILNGLLVARLSSDVHPFNK